jgi:hypothetical protein
MTLWQKIKNLFTAKKQSNVSVPVTPPSVVDTPSVVLPKPIDSKPPEDLLTNWTKRALVISQTFEGNDPWANITGNFDGAGLTCGALGWTIKWGNQQRLVKEYVTNNGHAKAKLLMPTVWTEYYRIISIPSDTQAISEANHWSNNTAKVIEPVKAELRAFWKCPEMVAMQIKYAGIDMGHFAMKQSLATQAFFKAPENKFAWFAYYFDMAVLNGTGHVIILADADKLSANTLFNSMKDEHGYLEKDLQANIKYWSQRVGLKDVTTEQLVLLKAAYLRSALSRPEFQPVTLCRRGTLAMHKGFVNGTFHDFTKELA